MIILLSLTSLSCDKDKLKTKADPEDLWTPMRARELEKVESIIESSPELLTHEYGAYQMPPLHWAANVKDIELAKIFIEAGADVNAENSKHFSPITIAIEPPKAKTGELMEILGEEARAKYKYVEPPSEHANPALAMVKLLVEHGASVNPKSFTPVCSAAQVGDAEILLYLIEKGASIDAGEENGAYNDLFCATTAATAKILIEHGANVNAGDNYRPLHWKIKKCHLEVAEVLINNGADLEAEDEFTETALHVAVEKVDHECRMAAIDLLLSNGADINPRDKRGRTPLTYLNERIEICGKCISLEFYKKTAKYLIDQGALE